MNPERIDKIIARLEVVVKAYEMMAADLKSKIDSNEKTIFMSKDRKLQAETELSTLRKDIDMYVEEFKKKHLEPEGSLKEELS